MSTKLPLSVLGDEAVFDVVGSLLAVQGDAAADLQYIEYLGERKDEKRADLMAMVLSRLGG